jgi:transcriptional regulator with XRE-family HTH domain
MAENPQAPAPVTPLEKLRRIVACARHVTKTVRLYFPSDGQWPNLTNRDIGGTVLREILHAQVQLEAELAQPPDATDPQPTLRQRLRDCRLAKKLSHGALARKAKLSARSVDALERDAKDPEPDKDALWKLAEALGVKPRDLVPPCRPKRGDEFSISSAIVGNLPTAHFPARLFLAVKRVLDCHDALLEQCGWRARVVNDDDRGYRWNWTEGKRGSPIPTEQIEALEKAGPQLDALDWAADFLERFIEECGDRFGNTPAKLGQFNWEALQAKLAKRYPRWRYLGRDLYFYRLEKEEELTPAKIRDQVIEKHPEWKLRQDNSGAEVVESALKRLKIRLEESA